MDFFAKKNKESIDSYIKQLKKDHIDLLEIKFKHQPPVEVNKRGRTDHDEALDDLAQSITEIEDRVADIIEHYEERVTELEDNNEKLEALTQPDWHNGDHEGQKKAIAADLVNNCTVQEMEALEMLMRIKHGRKYVETRAGLTHPDHIDLSVLFNKLEMAVSKKGNVYATVLIPKA